MSFPSVFVELVELASLDGLRLLHVSVVSRQVQCTEKDRPGSVAAAESLVATCRNLITENLMISYDIQIYNLMISMMISYDIQDFMISEYFRLNRWIMLDLL